MARKVLDRDEVWNRYLSALVHIKVEGRDPGGEVVRPRLGTGMVVGADGLIVTAGHVVGTEDEWAETAPGSGLRDRTITVRGLDQRSVEFDLGKASVQRIPGDDVVLLWVNAQDLPAVPLANQLPPNNGNLVALLWNPGGRPRPVVGDLEPTDRSRYSSKLTVHRLGVVEGNSGSGLFDNQFRLTGIILNRLDNEGRALATPIVSIAPFIERLIGGKASTPGRRTITAERRLQPQHPPAASPQLRARNQNRKTIEALRSEDYLVRLDAVADLNLKISQGVPNKAKAAIEQLQHHLQVERDEKVCQVVIRILQQVEKDERHDWEFLLVAYNGDQPHRTVVANGRKLGLTNRILFVQQRKYTITLEGVRTSPEKRSGVPPRTSEATPWVVTFEDA